MERRAHDIQSEDWHIYVHTNIKERQKQRQAHSPQADRMIYTHTQKRQTEGKTRTTQTDIQKKYRDREIHTPQTDKRIYTHILT